MRKLLRRLILWALEQDAPAIERDDRSYSERTWRFTRFLTVVGFGISLFSLVGTVYLLSTIWTANNNLVASNPDFKFDASFDAIAAAAAVGRLDLVAMILTFIGLVGAFSLIYGWTAFRSVAIDAAKAETQLRVPQELQNLMNSDGDRLVGIALQDAELLAKIQQGFTAAGIDDTEEAIGVDTDADWTDEETTDEQGAGTTTDVSPDDPRERGGSGGKSWFDRLFGRGSQ